MKYKQKIFWLLASLLAFTAPREVISQNVWTPTNGIYGGNIQHLAIDSNGSIYAVSTAGVFRTDEDGANWIDANQDLSWGVASIATDSHGYVYACKSDTVFQSKDHGATWAQILNSPNLTFIALAINKKNYIFAAGNSFRDGVHRSTDGGLNWTIATLVNTFDIYALACNNAGHIFALTDSGIFRSTDDGASYVRVNDTLTSYTGSLAISPNGHIFASTDRGVYRSVDSGLTWEISKGSSDSYNVSLGIDRNGNIFAGSAGYTHFGLFRSSDDGANWSLISDPTDHAHYWAFAPISNGLIFTGTDRGVLKSNNTGSSWAQANNGITAATVYSLSIDSNGNMFAANYYGGGVFISTDGGSNWRLINRGITDTVTHLYSMMAANNYIYAGSDGGNILRGTLSGGWKAVNTGVANVPVSTMTINKLNHVFTGSQGGGVCRSIDNGDTWEQADSLTNGNQFVYSMALHQNGVVFAGTYSGIIHSTNNGNIWTPLQNGINEPIASVAINTSGFIFAGGQKSPFGTPANVNLYRSTNNGGSWIESGKGQLGTGTVNSLAFNSQNHVIAGTSGGVYFSKDNGNSWSSMNYGLKDLSIQTVVVDKNGYAFAGSITGVYKTEHSTTSGVNEYTNSSKLFGNYPNPFKPSTKIRFQLSAETFITLKVYDLCGREVATLLNEHGGQGSYTIPFDGSNLPSGIYEYRLHAGDISQTGKMTLLK